MNILSIAAIASIISLVEAKKKAYKYPEYAKPRGGTNYPARLPRNQIVPAKPAQTLSPIKPTIPPRIVPEESWDATVTEWVSVVDPRQVVTETVTATITLAKLQIAESETYEDTFTETEDFTDDNYDYDEYRK